MNKLKERNSKDISRSSDLTTKVLINPVTETKEIQLFCCIWVLQRRVKEDDSLCRLIKQIASIDLEGNFEMAFVRDQYKHRYSINWPSPPGTCMTLQQTRTQANNSCLGPEICYGPITAQSQIKTHSNTFVIPKR